MGFVAGPRAVVSFPVGILEDACSRLDVVVEGPFVHVAVGESEGAAAVHLVGSPFADVRRPVGVAILARPVHAPRIEVALVALRHRIITVRPAQHPLALAVPLVVGPRAFISIGVGLEVVARPEAVLLAVAPVAVVLELGRPQPAAALDLAVVPLALVDVAVGVPRRAVTVDHVGLPLAPVHAAVGVRVRPTPVPLPVAELALVLLAVAVFDRPAAVELAVARDRALVLHLGRLLVFCEEHTLGRRHGSSGRR
mmetsp:Transcript_491/g.1888  ORF Transcript_491/g.1888 Transcript_491/m.1888 type:complete len:253 (+) Transcript_491:625-1383(+)